MEDWISFCTNPIKKLKTTWNRASPYKKWRYFYRFGLFVEEIIKLRTFSKKPIGILGYYPGIACLIHYSLLAYTVYYCISIGKFSDCLPSFCMFGCMASVYTAYWPCLTKSRFEWYRLQNVAGKLLYRDNNEETSYNHVCTQSIYDSIRNYIISMILTILASSGGISLLIYDIIFNGSYATIYNLKIPYLHESPRTEFLINIAWEIFINLMGICGILVIELSLAICINTITVSSKLSVLELTELSDELEKKSETIAKQLKMIFMGVLHMDEYVISLGNIMYLRNFATPPLSTFSIAVSIYCQYMMSFPGGYGIAIIAYVQMIILCYNGQSIKDRNKRLLGAFYDFKWYLLPTKDQKDVMHMINRMQNGVCVTIGPFEPLNFKTLKTLNQKVYSFLMLLFRTHSV